MNHPLKPKHFNFSLFIITILVLIISPIGWSQSYDLTVAEEQGMSSERLDRITKHFEAYLGDSLVAGIQTLVARKGQIVHFESQGYADLATEQELDASSIFRIYSMTKPIVSVALMMLYEEGLFQLDDPVSKYIPEFADLTVFVNGKIAPAQNEMKIIDLLRHTSGLGYGWGPGTKVDTLYAASEFWRSGDLREFATKVSELPLYFEPGNHWRYGISTDILGFLVEVLSGQNLNNFLIERIFKPLKMEDTFFGVPKEKISRYTTCYSPTENGGLEIQDHPSTSRFAREVNLYSGGGGLQSTTLDYLKFCTMLLNGGKANGIHLLSPKTIELMTVDHTGGITHGGGPLVFPNDATGFGLGFSVNLNLAKTQNLGSEGSYGWGGAAGTYFVIDPVEKLVLIQMIQLMPYNHLNHRSEFHTLVYQSIID